MTGTAQIIQGNALALPFTGASVDLICTSPPYFGLRSYQDGGEHYAGQIGAEPTPAEFVDALIAATREMVRVLKPSGSIWVNLGDKYAGAPSGPRTGGIPPGSGVHDAISRKAIGAWSGERRITQACVPTKSLIGIPWRYALRCIDDLGLILRAEVIWSKPNGLPESVTDRVRRSHETWFHFTVNPRYYSAVDEIREAHTSIGDPRWNRATKPSNPDRNDGGVAMWRDGKEPNPLGKLPGSVWSIPTQPLQVPAELGIDHFAAFPFEFPRRIIQGWSPAGVCTACGEGRRPSYACACPPFGEPAPTVPSVILDPFGGTGTTALMAKALGRQGISVDMSADYCRLATWRTTDPGQMATALQVEKPEPIHPDQLDLFGDHQT